MLISSSHFWSLTSKNGKRCLPCEMWSTIAAYRLTKDTISNSSSLTASRGFPPPSDPSLSFSSILSILDSSAASYPSSTSSDVTVSNSSETKSVDKKLPLWFFRAKKRPAELKKEWKEFFKFVVTVQWLPKGTVQPISTGLCAIPGKDTSKISFSRCRSLSTESSPLPNNIVSVGQHFLKEKSKKKCSGWNKDIFVVSEGDIKCSHLDAMRRPIARADSFSSKANWIRPRPTSLLKKQIYQCKSLRKAHRVQLAS